MIAVAAIYAGILQIGYIIRSAMRAAGLAIGPPDSDHELTAILEIAEVLNCLLECLWCSHVMKIA